MIFERADQVIGYDVQGSGPPVLFLHGFPQCRAMWRPIVSVLSARFTCVTADLRGYGESVCAGGVSEMSFRKMAADQAALMEALGFERFHLVGHDRGARTAHRIALDHEARVGSLTLMDIVPTHLLLNELRADVARAYYHWFFLAQSSGVPERMIAQDPDMYYESCLGGWGGSGLEAFDAELLDIYRGYWRQPAIIASMNDDYRAAIDIDQHDDAEDLERQVSAPALVLFGADGLMGQAYDVAATWAPRLAQMTATPMPGGHFFPDTHADETAAALGAFLARHTL
ncbi:alpha/beta fold hydrolase [Roseobacteraceae bacterium S113]